MNKQPLAGSRALVIGRSSGNGRGIAFAFADAGAKVVVTYRLNREEG